MMVAAWVRDIIPAFTKPMTITVVAPELWMAAVPTVPMPTPSRRLRDALENSALSLVELADSRLELIIWAEIIMPVVIEPIFSDANVGQICKPSNLWMPI